MKYKKIICNNFNLHIIQNKKCHSIELIVNFTENVNKKKLNYRNVLMDVLTSSSKKYPSKAKLYRKCQELYSLFPKASTIRQGNYLRTKFGISILKSLYIDKSNVLDNILLLKEILLNPLVENECFNAKYVNIIKNNLIVETKTIEEDPRLYANMMLLKKMGKNSNYALTGYCDIDILNEINAKNLYTSYLEMLHNSKIDIFMAGDIENEDKLIQIIQSNFIFNDNHYKLVEPIIYHQKQKNNYHLVKESRKYYQSKLSIGCKFYDLNIFQNRYVVPLLDNIIGASEDSLLMQEVREKKSLCYYINSYNKKMDNLLIINSAISKENCDKVITLIQDIIIKLQNGAFKDKKLINAQNSYITDLKQIRNTNSGYIEYIVGREVFASDELNERIKLIKTVSKQDIMDVARKMDIDTIFYLEGDL